MHRTTQFQGTHTALVTPMLNNSIDFESLTQLVDNQLDQGINGLVPMGTTGESPTLSAAEHLAVVKAVVDQVQSRVPVIAGAGTNNTAEAVKLTQQVDAAGASAILHVTPYYNKPSQEGLFQHFRAIAEATAKPIILYSIPGRCIVELDVATVARLHDCFPHICGIKESAGSCARVLALRAALGPNFTILSGEDAMTLPFMAAGADGVIHYKVSLGESMD
jgi:4-hydroxy-tetrahydrodipicolinate synthase